MSDSVRNLSVEDSYLIKEINPKASAIGNGQVWPKGKKMLLVCIVRQTEYFIIFLLLGLQLSKNASKSWRLQENPVASTAEHRAGMRWKGFLPVELSLQSGSMCHLSRAPLLGELQAHTSLLSAGAVLLLAEHSYPNRDKSCMSSQPGTAHVHM